ncbi:GH10464 [Drosophila grimshawi]|uniref:GH10464 n=2 Tax=Drosophila grimshawi TaxID=7222 RepID=B4JDZ3_DROGR|nr:GH10464 [Drosophila grimshawi]
MLEHIGTMQQYSKTCNTSQVGNIQDRLNHLEGQMVTQQEKAGSCLTAIEEIKCNLVDQEKLINIHKKSVSKPFQKIGSNYYYIEKNTHMNWFAAAHKCTDYGGHLLSLDNEEEWSALKPHLDFSKSFYWVDINDLAKEGQYISLTTGRPAQYIPWKPNEPNNVGGEHCARLENNKQFPLNDLRCYDMAFFICESFNK